MRSPVVNVQTTAPVAALSAFILPSPSLPMKTVPLATAGEADIAPPVVAAHTLRPDVADNAYTLWSDEPTYTTPPTTAGVPSTGWRVAKLHSLWPVFASMA